MTPPTPRHARGAVRLVPPPAPAPAPRETAPRSGAGVVTPLRTPQTGGRQAEPVRLTLDDILPVVPAQPRRLMRSLRVALVGEGAYPFGPGGVSLWCHQLIEGMPEHAFTAVALTVDGTEQSVWDPPENLAKVVNIPLWGVARGRGPHQPASTPAFVEAHQAFLDALLAPVEEMAVPSPGRPTFEAALQAMTQTAHGGDVSRELRTDDAVQRLVDTWRDARPGGAERDLTLREAVAATARIEHMLRPLSHPPVEADVCHLSMSGISALVGMHSKWALGTPLVVSEHGVYLRERYLALNADPAPHAVKELTTRFHRALNSATYRTADVLAPHSAFNRRWQRYGGGRSERTETMYNGIDPADFPAARDEPDEPTLVFVGRIDRLKDLHTLIRAFADVRAELPAARLRVFGPVTPNNAEYHRSCLALVDELGVTGAATFEGRIPHTRDAYRAGHVVVLPSVSEGFPFTLIEAMSMGRPPVATDVGGVSEAVGDAGFVVPPRDHEAIARACLTLLGDADLRREMGDRARRRVLDRFTLRQWTDAYREVYAGLAPSGRARHAAAPAAGHGRQVVVDLSDLAPLAGAGA